MHLCSRALTVIASLALAAPAPPALAAEGEFPDAWYYYGAKRPDRLRAMEGKPAPKLSLTNWVNGSIDPDDLEGRVLVVDFWGNWCGPCMGSIPKNLALVEQHGEDGLAFVGVHTKRASERAAQVVQKSNINYPVAVDDSGAAHDAWKVKFWPTYAVVDRDGIVRAAGLRPDRVENVVLKLLEERRSAGQSFDDVEITVTKVSGHVYMLKGRGGNIGLSIGEDGTFLIDDQYAPLTDRILEAVATVTDAPVQFVVNTHWHGDHTGGNENLGKAGAIIVAHENVRRRMSTDQFIEAFDSRVPAAPPAALPKVTFNDSVTFHWNDDELRVFYVEPAHTDGDSIIIFRRANVVHMGDTFFHEMYPFIDVSSGGSIDGMIAAVDRVLGMVDADAKVIPGHGPLSDVRGLRTYRDMLATVRDRVRALVDAGKTRDEVVAAGPTHDFDAAWGGGFLDANRWVGIVYDGMIRSSAP